MDPERKENEKVTCVPCPAGKYYEEVAATAIFRYPSESYRADLVDDPGTTSKDKNTAYNNFPSTPHNTKARYDDDDARQYAGGTLTAPGSEGSWRYTSYQPQTRKWTTVDPSGTTSPPTLTCPTVNGGFTNGNEPIVVFPVPGFTASNVINAVMNSVGGDAPRCLHGPFAGNEAIVRTYKMDVPQQRLIVSLRYEPLAGAVGLFLNTVSIVCLMFVVCCAQGIQTRTTNIDLIHIYPPLPSSSSPPPPPHLRLYFGVLKHALCAL